MTLSEAIADAERNARRYELRAEEILRQSSAMGLSLDQANLYMQYAKDQRQIKEWLRELQLYRWQNRMDAD
ncbi:MAG: hypothetical protein K6E49_00515 [Lachnospiraceae bacterium]|nr:hypothetical protein [Lachnospiraceae bacterium]